MIAPAIGEARARAVLQARLHGLEPARPLSDLIHEIGVVPRGDVGERVGRARSGLMGLVASCSDRSGRVVEVSRFEADAAVLVHQEFGSLPVRVASDTEFWLYLSCGPFFEAISARYPTSAERPPNLKNFGIGGKWDCMPRRLWFRGQIAFDPTASDPYHLVRRGHVDFWISGLIRVLYGANPAIARALVRFQYPERGTYRGDSFRPATLDVYQVGGVRELYKRIRHLNATTELAVLSDSEADELIRDLASGLMRSA